MIDIFLSYAHEDRHRIEPLIAALEAQNWTVWWDNLIEPGSLFDLEIESAIESAGCVLVLWSAISVNSKWVRSEAHEGLDRDILVPAMLDDVRPPLPFRQIQSLNFFDPPLSEQSDFSSLIEAVRHALNPTDADFGLKTVKPKKTLLQKLFSRPAVPLLTVLLLLSAVFYYSFIRTNSPPPVVPQDHVQTSTFNPPANSIAVLPFLNLSGDPANDYFSDGIAEDVLNSLGSLDKLKVTARSSSFSFRGQGMDIKSIGRRLNVGLLLEGSVRKQGNIVRISVQLADSNDGNQIWSATYDMDMADIFSVQENVSRAVVDALEVATVGEENHQTSKRTKWDVATFDIYLLGKHYWYQRTVEGINRSIKLFKQAIASDPEFVLAYTGLADAYNLLTAYGNLSGQEAAALMKPAVEKAMELDDSIPEVHTSYGAMLGNLGLLAKEEEAYRKAIAINQNYALAYIWLGNNLLVQYQLTEGIEIFQQALALDPLNPAVILNLARTEMYLGKIGQSLEHIALAESLEPNSALVNEQKAWALREYGRLDESLLAARKAVSLDPEGAQVLVGIANSELAMGMFEDANYWIERASQSALDNWHVVWMKSEAYFLRGRHEALDAYAEERLSISLSDSSHSGPDLKTVYYWAGLAKLMAGQYEKAANYLDAAYSPAIEHRFEAPQELMFMGYRVHAHRQAKHPEIASGLLLETQELLATSMQQGWKIPDFLVRAAAIHVLAGDKATALEFLQKAVDSGYRYFLVLENDPVLRSLESEPEFEELLIRIKMDLVRMQKVFSEP